MEKIQIIMYEIIATTMKINGKKWREEKRRKEIKNIGQTEEKNNNNTNNKNIKTTKWRAPPKCWSGRAHIATKQMWAKQTSQSVSNVIPTKNLWCEISIKRLTASQTPLSTRLIN